MKLGGAMTMERAITPRQRALLTAIIESYIETGEPVSSAAVAVSLMRDGATVSSATVRNEMAALGDAGLLEQPHTSAGRVPSALAFRLYVEDLRGGERIAPARLSAQSRGQIDASLAGLTGTQALLERTTQVLAMLSSGVGMAIAGVTESELLEHVHFSRLADRRVMAVVVTRGGLVRNRVLELERDLRPAELDAASNLLNEQFRGWTLERVRAELAERVERERSEYQRIFSAAQQLWQQAMPQHEGTQTVYIGGVANLIETSGVGRGQPWAQDRERLREMLAALEEKGRVVELLNAFVATRAQDVGVVFELEQQAPEMAGLVLVAAPALVDGMAHGAFAVLAPQRMHYERTMNAVGYVAQVVERLLAPHGLDDAPQPEPS
jgi:heat-inducible transcriptional repressor